MKGVTPWPVEGHDDVRAFFDELAADYGETHGGDGLLAYRVDVLRELLGERGPELLEVGCGAGLHLEALGGTVGVDLSAGMLARTRARCPNARLVRTSAETLAGVDDASVDAVVLVGVLEHLLDKRAALEAAARVLRPGGVLALLTPDGAHPWYRLADRAGFGVRHLASDRFVTRPELRDLAEGAGLAVEREGTWRFVPAGDMPRWAARAMRLSERLGWPGGLSLRARRPA